MTDGFFGDEEPNFEDADVVVKEETLADTQLSVYPSVQSVVSENTLDLDSSSTPFYYHQTFVAAIANAQADPRCMSLLKEAEVSMLNAFYKLSRPAQLFVFV